MSNLDKQFELCTKIINSSKPGEGPELTNELKLKFYALYKQATIGKCTGKAPSRFNVIAYYKYNAWKALGAIS